MTNRLSRRDDVQGIRALAVLFVVAYHAGLPLPGGFSGVDIFFVISGFVIGRLLLHELDEHGTLRFGKFFGQRIRRLVPALSVTLIVTVIAAGALLASWRLDEVIDSAIAAEFMLANVFFYRHTGGYFDVSEGEVPLLHTWTLSVEAQFYVVVPIALLTIAWFTKRVGLPTRRTLAVATLVTLVGSFAAAQLLAGGHTAGGRVGDPQAFAFYGSPTRAWEFLAGALVALAEPRLRQFGRAGVADALAVLGFVGVLASAFLAGKGGPVPGLGVALPVLATALLIAASTASPRGPGPTILSWKPFTSLGDVSYSWYLWHWPLIVLGAIALPTLDLAPVLAFAALLPAVLSYRYVEERFRRGSRSGRRTVAVAATAIAAVVVVSLGVTRLQGTLIDRSGIGNLRAALSAPALVESGACRDDAGRPWLPGSAGAARCLPDAPADQPRLLLVGDSQSDAFAYAFREIARQRRMRFDVITGPSCFAAPLRSARGRPIVPNPECEGMPEAIAQTVLKDPPRLLVVAQANIGPEADPIEGRTDSAEARNRAFAQRASKALTTLARPVLAAGGRVLVIAAIPQMKADGTTCATLWRLLRKQTSACLEVPRSGTTNYARRLPYWQGVASAAARTAGVTVFDPATLFCGPRICSQVRGNELAYRNPTHLSVGGALGAVPELSRAVTDALGTPKAGVHHEPVLPR